MASEDLRTLIIAATAVLFVVGLVVIVPKPILWLRRRASPTRQREKASTPVPRGRPLVVLGQARPVQMEAGMLPPMIRRGLPLVVPRREDPLWYEKGWHRNGRRFEGDFRAGRHRWRGLIDQPYPGSFDAYIWNPPLADLAQRTNHRPCFQQPRPDGRYRIHFHTMPNSIDHAITSVEAVLAEAFGVWR